MATTKLPTLIDIVNIGQEWICNPTVNDDDVKHIIAERYPEIVSIWNGTINAMPKGLLALVYNGSPSAEHIKKLPSSLIYLSLASGISMEAVPFIPRSVRHLCIGHGEYLDFCAIPYLPPLLEALSISLDCEDYYISQLPRTLKYLKLRSKRPLTKATLKNLPRGLLTLIIDDPYFEDTDIGDLPPGLLKLSIPNMYFSGVRSLPKSLRILEMHSFAYLSAEMPQLTALTCTGEFSDVNMPLLPSSLKYLSLKNATGVSNFSIAALPRGLETLRIPRSRGITSKAFASMPSGLTEVSLWCTNNPEYIKHHARISTQIPAAFIDLKTFTKGFLEYPHSTGTKDALGPTVHNLDIVSASEDTNMEPAGIVSQPPIAQNHPIPIDQKYLVTYRGRCTVCPPVDFYKASSSSAFTYTYPPHAPRAPGATGYLGVASATRSPGLRVGIIPSTDSKITPNREAPSYGATAGIGPSVDPSGTCTSGAPSDGATAGIGPSVDSSGTCCTTGSVGATAGVSVDSSGTCTTGSVGTVSEEPVRKIRGLAPISGVDSTPALDVGATLLDIYAKLDALATIYAKNPVRH